MVSQITPLVAAAYCLVGTFYASMAILNGQGRPLPVALAFFVGAFSISPLLGYVLTFSSVRCCDFGEGTLPLYGLWFGLIGGYGVTTFISIVAVLRSDWRGLATRAQERSEAAPARSAAEPAAESVPVAEVVVTTVPRAGHLQSSSMSNPLLDDTRIETWPSAD